MFVRPGHSALEYRPVSKRSDILGSGGDVQDIGFDRILLPCNLKNDCGVWTIILPLSHRPCRELVPKKRHRRIRKTPGPPAEPKNTSKVNPRRTVGSLWRAYKVCRHQGRYPHMSTIGRALSLDSALAQSIVIPSRAWSPLYGERLCGSLSWKVRGRVPDFTDICFKKISRTVWNH